MTKTVAGQALSSLGLLLGSLAGILVVLHVQAVPARACTVVAGYDPVASSAAVVAGQIAGVENVEGDEFDTEFILTIRVDRWLKGPNMGETIEVIVVTSQPGEMVACASFDPERLLGRMLVAGLEHSQLPGIWTTGVQSTWFTDTTEPEGSHRRNLVALYEGRTVAPGPPDTGSGTATVSHAHSWLLALAVAALGAAAITLFGTTMHRRR